MNRNPMHLMSCATLLLLFAQARDSVKQHSLRVARPMTPERQGLSSLTQSTTDVFLRVLTGMTGQHVEAGRRCMR